MELNEFDEDPFLEDLLMSNHFELDASELLPATNPYQENEVSVQASFYEHEIEKVPENASFQHQPTEITTSNNSSASNRFTAVNVNEFLEDSINKNTKRKTECDIKLFSSFLLSKEEHRLVEYIPPDELNLFLCEFLLSVRKRDGSEFEPSTIRGIVSSLDRFLRSKDTNISIIKDKEFEKARNVLKAKQKHLKSLGLGNKPKAAEPLTDEHLEAMYEAGTLGDSNPRALLHSMWLICTTHFGMRTGYEVYNLRWGDINLCLDDTSGTEYLILDTERQTKTRTGTNHKDTRILKPRAYAQPDVPIKDPVHLYKVYSVNRPEGFCKDDSPFFLTPGNPNHSCWYKKTAMGINSLYNIMNEMKAGTQIANKRITPYSSRKMLVQKLSDEGVPPNQIVQVSGHKNVNSLNNYSRINDNQSKHISSILSGVHSGSNSNQIALPSASATPPTCNQIQQPFSQFPGPIPGGFFANCSFNGSITFNLSRNESHHMDQHNTCNNLTQADSEDSPLIPNPYKRIRQLSESDSD